MTGPASIGLCGLLGGFLVGFLVQRSRLCTFGAVEDALMGHDWRRMKVFGIALALATLCAQALIVGGILDPDQITYLPSRLPVMSLFLGGLLFGLGMAFVGTCGFGSLVRLGTGDLRALIVILVFGLVAYSTLRGVLSGLRIDGLEAVTIPMPGPSRADLPTQIGRWIGLDTRLLLALVLAAILLFIAARDKRLKRSPRLVSAGIALGLVVGLGWFATSALVDPFIITMRPQSLTFVAPVARGLVGVLAGQDSALDFGVASVAGVVLGAFAASLYAREFRWEAFDDQHEMRRYLLGAALMGFGGVLAGGCTIGQGLTAGSLLAFSMPVAVIGMIIGARLGIALIVGEMRDWWLRWRGE